SSVEPRRAPTTRASASVRVLTPSKPLETETVACGPSAPTGAQTSAYGAYRGFPQIRGRFEGVGQALGPRLASRPAPHAVPPLRSPPPSGPCSCGPRDRARGKFGLRASVGICREPELHRF